MYVLTMLCPRWYVIGMVHEGAPTKMTLQFFKEVPRDDHVVMAQVEAELASHDDDEDHDGT
eukprot:COSAG05_NODE_345_length_10977_cov_17.229178_5_plen_61_part_00